MNWLIRFFAIMIKEFRQLRRDKITFAMIIGIPVGQILLFGYAINTDIRDLKAAVADQSNSHLSREFISELGQTQVVAFQSQVQSADDLEQLLRVGDISIGVFIPHDFDRRTQDSSRPAAHLLVDGTDPTVVNVANQLASFPVGFKNNIRRENLRSLEVKAYYNPNRRTAVNIIPGLLGIILTLTMTLFTAVAIVREREHGNLELLINTPVSTAQLMLGKVVPYILIGLIQVALILAVGQFLFNVPLRGTLLDLYSAAIVFIAANLALGLFISTVAKTQFQAIQITIMFLLPSILLSGFMFPFDGMPTFAQYLGEVLPNTHFIRLTRGIMLREAALLELKSEIIALMVFTLLAMVAAILRFSRRLD
ncbi:ABC transporter permease [Aurantivibrio infirmus]